MWRIVALCWVITAPALAGALVVATLATPPLAAQAQLWLPIAALLGALYGLAAARRVAGLIAPAAAAAMGRGGHEEAAPVAARPLVARHLRLVVF